MAKYALLMGFILMVAPGFGETPQTFVPSGETGVPTYLNAEVVRVDREADTVTLRSESGNVVLTVDRGSLPGLAGLRPGDKVLAAYQTVVDADGAAVRIVMSVRPTSPTSGEPGIGVAAVATSATARNVRVLGVNGAARTITVVDETGVPEVLAVQGEAALHLHTLRPGDTVALSLVASTGAAGAPITTVTGFEAMPASVVSEVVFVPSVSGQLVRFDGAAGTVTMVTASGEQTFPVGPTGLLALRGFRPGENLSLDFSVTTAATGAPTGTVRRARLVAGSFPSVVGVRAAAAPGTVTMFGPTPATPIGVSGATAVAVTPAAGTVAPVAVNVPAVPGFAIATAAGPLTNPVPSVPTPTPTTTVVLPPAVAKAPSTAEEVGLMRAQGERDFDLAAMALAMRANEIDVAWARFENVCVVGPAPATPQGREWFLLLDDGVRLPTDDTCRAMHADLRNQALGFEAQLDIALDAARRADVLPGRIRETLERYAMLR